MSLGKFPDFLLNFSGRKMNGEENHSYCFKSFRLDVEERRLFHNDVPVSLEPKVFDVLAVLVERSGHLVEKDELLHLVWSDSFVEETNIARNVYTLRKVLGEERGGQKFIETVAKKGYRFVAEVNEIREPSEPKSTNGKQDSANFVETPTIGESQIPTLKADEIVAPPAVMPKRNLRIILFAVGSLSAVFLILLLSFNFRSGSSDSPNEVKSIAVLPLKPVNTETRDLIYELGIAESLIFRLSSIKGFVVRPLSATRKYADIAQDPIAAGREQQVNYVLASNYQLAGGKIKVTSQLINVANGQIEETYKSENDAANLFAMQDAIAGEVGNLLLTRFAVTSNSPTTKRGTTNEEAYRLYLQGMYLVDKRDPASARKAVEIFEEAVRLDPNYAQAWAGKAHAHRTIGNLGRSVNTQEQYQKSIEAINKALALDANLADAHSVLCQNKMLYEYDFDGAERECKRAVELDPNSALAHQIYSRYLLGRGHFDEAIAEIKTAIDIEPTSLFSQRNLGSSLYSARRYEEAAAQLKRVIAMEPNFTGTYPFLWQSLEMQGNYAEAFEWFMKFQALQKTDEETLQLYKTAFQTSGWKGVLLEQVKQFERTNFAYFLGAVFNARAENKDKAFEYLEKSYQRRELWMNMLKVEPGLDSLRDDPRFDELVRRVGLK